MSNHLGEIPDLAELRTHSSTKWRDFPGDVLPLPVAEMDFQVAQPIRAKLSEMVSRSDLGYLGSIPEVGLGFQKFAASRWGWAMDPQQVRIAADVGVAVVEILRIFTKPGDAILINSPIYHNYYNWITETGLSIVDAPFDRTGDEDENPWEINWDGIEKAYASGIKVHFVVNPHNPLGRLYSKEELSRLVALAKKHNVLIISNELHAPLTYIKENFVPILSLGSDAQAVSIVVTAASKGWNIAGLKCAIILTQNDGLNEKLKSLPAAMHYRASLLGGFATAVAFAECEPWLDEALVQMDHNRYLVKELLAKKLPTVRYHIPQAGYLAWLDLESLNLGEDPSVTLLEKGRVAFNAGHTFGKQSSQYVRLNFATSPEIITEAIERIAKVI
jgi:cystathionine beta-lyase